AGILASVAAGSAWFNNRRGSAPQPPAAPSAPVSAAKSIAVMPLVNISRDTSDAYFAAGMTAEVTNALSRIPGLRVASANENSKQQAQSPAELGRALNVTMV